ncbi:MAG: hypothetical protein M3R29_05100 [Verrucomicrobiota bacterium]|nr:hypothetical protein [Verrucomicrobiota bacterium]
MRPSVTLFVTIFSLAHASLAVAGDHLPGDTITNSKGTTLQNSVRNYILAIELTLAPACKKPRITQTAIIGEPRRLGRMMQWNERWTVDRCGTNALYLIHFDFRGSVGTFKIEPPKA